MLPAAVSSLAWKLTVELVAADNFCVRAGNITASAAMPTTTSEARRIGFKLFVTGIGSFRLNI
jgi:hypothetical protein